MPNSGLASTQQVGSRSVGFAASRRQLQQFPEAMQAVIQAAHALRRPMAELTAQGVEMSAGKQLVA
jgi:hypothetical protein